MFLLSFLKILNKSISRTLCIDYNNAKQNRLGRDRGRYWFLDFQNFSFQPEAIFDSDKLGQFPIDAVSSVISGPAATCGRVGPKQGNLMSKPDKIELQEHSKSTYATYRSLTKHGPCRRRTQILFCQVRDWRRDIILNEGCQGHDCNDKAGTFAYCSVRQSPTNSRVTRIDSCELLSDSPFVSFSFRT